MKPDLTEIDQLKKTTQNYHPENYLIGKERMTPAVSVEALKDKVPIKERIEGFKIFIDAFQKKSKAPARFSHSLTISLELFIECCMIGIIDTKHLCSESIAFFQFQGDQAVISFDRFYIANDIHIRILEHVVFRKTGEIPVKRNAKSKVDQDAIDINKHTQDVIDEKQLKVG